MCTFEREQMFEIVSQDNEIMNELRSSIMLKVSRVNLKVVVNNLGENSHYGSRAFSSRNECHECNYMQ